MFFFFPFTFLCMVKLCHVIHYIVIKRSIPSLLLRAGTVVEQCGQVFRRAAHTQKLVV